MQGTKSAAVKDSGIQFLLQLCGKAASSGEKTEAFSFGDILRDALVRQGGKKGLPLGVSHGKAKAVGSSLPLKKGEEKDRPMVLDPKQLGKIGKVFVLTSSWEGEMPLNIARTQDSPGESEIVLLDPKILACMEKNVPVAEASIIGENEVPALIKLMELKEGENWLPVLYMPKTPEVILTSNLWGVDEEAVKLKPPCQVLVEKVAGPSLNLGPVDKAKTGEIVKITISKGNIKAAKGEIGHITSRVPREEDQIFPAEEAAHLPSLSGGERFFIPVAAMEFRELIVLKVEDDSEFVKISLELGKKAPMPELPSKWDDKTGSFKETIRAYLIDRGVDEKTAKEVVAQVKRVLDILSGEKEEKGTSLSEEEKGPARKERTLLFVKEEKTKENLELRGMIKPTGREMEVERPRASYGKMGSRPLREDSKEGANSVNEVNGRLAQVFSRESQIDNTSSPAPVKDEEIVSQVGRALESYSDKSGRVKVLLEPPHLGEVEMEVIVRGDRVRAVMVSDNEQVRQVLKHHAEEIRQVLADQGLKVERLEVKAPDDRSLPQWAGNGRQGEEREFYGRRKDGKPDEKEDETVNFAKELTMTV